MTDKEINFSVSDSLLKWLIGLILTALVAGGSLYGKWIDDNINRVQDNIAITNLHQIEQRQNLDIVNAKIDILLQANHLQYNGPKYPIVLESIILPKK